MFANVIAPSVLLLPGVLPLSGFAAFPASILAALIEGPFLAHAGLRRHVRCYSLQANLISLLLG
jgi:hypothetical protein